MHFSPLAAVATVLSVAQAVDVQVVSVGMNPVNNKVGLKFWPEKITAAPGSMVQFQFLAGNHTVTQSNFDNPCVPIEKVVPTAPGIFSSFQPVAASKGKMPVFTVMINDTKPLWFFCSQGPHCQKGMSLVVNENTKANASRSLENYQAAAAGGAPSGGAGGNGTYSGGGGYNPPSSPPTTTTPADGSQTTAAPTDSATATPSTTRAPVAGGASTAAVSGSLLALVGAVAVMML